MLVHLNLVCWLTIQPIRPPVISRIQITEENEVLRAELTMLQDALHSYEVHVCLFG